MRIIAGYLGGRNFASPPGHRTHPMSDKIRGALFNALGDIKGLTILDAFTGTGAVAFEAISRGAKHVTAIDIETSAIKTVIANAKSLDVEDRITPVRANVAGWTNKAMLVDRFDITIFDPPFDDIQLEVVEKVAKRTTWGGIAVFSLPPGARLILPDQFELLLHKNYGDAELRFYRHNQPSA